VRSKCICTRIRQLAPIVLMISAVAQGAESVPDQAQAFTSGFQGAGAHFEVNEGQLPSDAQFSFRSDEYRLDLVNKMYHDIDVRYYINEGRLEYDFILAPGADPTGIELKLDGAGKISLSENGGLQIAFPVGTILQHKPHVYQEIEGKKAHIYAEYALRDDSSVGFQVGDYDSSFPLVIDPILTVRLDGH